MKFYKLTVIFEYSEFFHFIKKGIEIYKYL